MILVLECELFMGFDLKKYILFNAGKIQLINHFWRIKVGTLWICLVMGKQLMFLISLSVLLLLLFYFQCFFVE